MIHTYIHTNVHTRIHIHIHSKCLSIFALYWHCSTCPSIYLLHTGTDVNVLVYLLCGKCPSIFALCRDYVLTFENCANRRQRFYFALPPPPLLACVLTFENCGDRRQQFHLARDRRSRDRHTLSKVPFSNFVVPLCRKSACALTFEDFWQRESGSARSSPCGQA